MRSWASAEAPIAAQASRKSAARAGHECIAASVLDSAILDASGENPARAGRGLLEQRGAAGAAVLAAGAA
jgi:hypothetical protein